MDIEYRYKYIEGRVADPVGSGVFAWIQIRIRFSNFSGSGSGFGPDFGTKKIAERSLKAIDQKKT